MRSGSPSINELSSAVVDTGRRGMPKPGCDCVQCFGYCLVDNDEAQRQAWAAAAGTERRIATGGVAELDFADKAIT